MEKQTKQYLRVLVIAQLLILAIVCAMVIYLAKNISGHNKQMFRMAAISEAEKTMSQRVENTIKSIEAKGEETKKQIEEWAAFACEMLENKEADEAVIKEVLEIVQHERYAKIIKAIVVYGDGKSVLYEDKSVPGEVMERKRAEQLIEQASIKKDIQKDNAVVTFLAEKEQIDVLIKQDIRDEIYLTAGEDNEYVWVNEILKMDGGENYAIRVIHPNLSDTEGEYLSTFTKDIEGNYPYLKELQGIKEKGELFQSYYFKNKTNGKMTEKLSYAKFYEPYQWIVATGKPLDEILSYTNELKEYDNKKTCYTIFIGMFLIVVICTGEILLVSKWKNKYRIMIEEHVKIRAEQDSLTGVLSRRSILAFLEDKKKAGKDEDALIILAEIDELQKISNTYGYDMGDLVIQKVAQVISSTVRKEDKVFRFKGSVFVLICEGIPKQEQRPLAEKILSRVNNEVFSMEDVAFQVSLSMGGCKKEKGSTYEETIERANRALGRAKRMGKNRYVDDQKEEECEV